MRGIRVAQGVPVLTDWWSDVRYAARSLMRAPVWTATLVLTIALGIGSTASVQGFVRGLVTTDLPIMGIEAVVTVFGVDRDGRSNPVPLAAFLALKERRDLFQSLGAIRESQERVAIGTRSSLLSVAAYTPDIGTVLPFPVRHGVTLGHRLRFAQFDANVDPAGRVIRIGAADVSIAGATPYWLEGLYRGRDVDLWLPLTDDDLADARSRYWLLGRLAPGISPAFASDAVAAMGDRSETTLAVVSYTGQTPEAAAGTQRVSAVLRVASNAVFLIACANVAAFLLARAAARARETAVRVAIGARRRQLVRQLLIDSALISVMGGAAGLLLASWMADIVPLLFFDQDASRLVFAPDMRGIVLTSFVCMLITITCGLVPLAETRDDEPSSVLQREIAGPSKRLQRVSTGLILLQMAGCSLLVISTGLLLQGFRASLETSAGRRLGNPILMTVEALQSVSKAQMSREGLHYFDVAVAEARSVTPMTDVVWAERLPGARPAWQWVRFDSPPASDREARVDVAALTPARLELLTLPPIAGRLFGAFDAGACGAVVINDAAAKNLFAGVPIGRTIDTHAGTSFEVIGVVRDRDVTPVIYEHPAATVPLGRDGAVAVRPPQPTELDGGLIDVNIVSPNYFDAMGLTLVDGQLFDADRSGCRIGVVNEDAAAHWFGGRATGGAVIDGGGRRTTIVGVVRSAQLRTEQRRPEPMLFLPMSQDFVPRMNALMAASDVGDDILKTIRQQVMRVPGGRPDRLNVTTLDVHLGKTALLPERIAAVLVAVFAALALVLGGLGLYGVLADSARRRSREFAVRLALGAQGWRVIRQLMMQGMRLAAAGTAGGMMASLVVARWLRGLTPGAELPSVTIWIAAPSLLAVAVMLASVIPARRAVSVDLVSLMRDM